jgi:hypothetical protein
LRRIDDVKVALGQEGRHGIHNARPVRAGQSENETVGPC